MQPKATIKTKPRQKRTASRDEIVRDIIRDKAKTVMEIAEEAGINRERIRDSINRIRNEVHVESWVLKNFGMYLPLYRLGRKKDAPCPVKRKVREPNSVSTEIEIKTAHTQEAIRVDSEVRKHGLIGYMRQKDPLMAALCGRTPCLHPN